MRSEARQPVSSVLLALRAATLTGVAALLASPLGAQVHHSAPDPAFPIACHYFPRSDDADSNPQDCARSEGPGRIVLNPRYLRQSSFSRPLYLSKRRYPRAAFAEVFTAESWYRVDRSGHGLAALPFDNGPDYFVEGLARANVGGKVGFMNPRLQIVIPARYDWATPFEGGRAQVCNGCKEVREPSDAEHTMIMGGLWGYIDRAGREVVPPTIPMKDFKGDGKR